MTMLDPGKFDLPPIPGKRYFTIGEVSKLCHVKPHVLRYWEQEFSQLRPIKRRSNRRYYQRHEVKLIRTIRDLLYIQGYTISGARSNLDTQQKEGTGGRSDRGCKCQHKQLEQTLLAELDEVIGILK